MGLDGMRLLTTEDQFEIDIMSEVANRAAQLEARRMETLASMIAHEVSKLFKK